MYCLIGKKLGHSYSKEIHDISPKNCLECQVQNRYQDIVLISEKSPVNAALSTDRI